MSVVVGMMPQPEFGYGQAALLQQREYELGTLGGLVLESRNLVDAGYVSEFVASSGYAI
jgi:hypothetical protein